MLCCLWAVKLVMSVSMRGQGWESGRQITVGVVGREVRQVVRWLGGLSAFQCCCCCCCCCLLIFSVRPVMSGR